MLYIFIVVVAVKCSCRNVPFHIFDGCRLGGRKKLQHPLSTSSDAPWFQPIIAHRPTCCFVGSSWDVVLAFLRARGGILQLSMLVCGVSLAHRVERCQREARPPGAGISQPLGGSLSTTLRICPTTTPRPREELCSAPRLEVLLFRMRKERDSE